MVSTLVGQLVKHIIIKWVLNTLIDSILHSRCLLKFEITEQLQFVSIDVRAHFGGNFYWCCCNRLHLKSHIKIGLVIKGHYEVCFVQFELWLWLLYPHCDVPLLVDPISVNILANWGNRRWGKQILRVVSDWLDCGILISVQSSAYILKFSCGPFLVKEKQLCINFVLECHLGILLWHISLWPKIYRKLI